MNSCFHLVARILALVGLLAFAEANAAEASSPIAGRISRTDGTPLEGATVFVFSAAPKTGTSPFCPSCYPDCAKTGKSDSAGAFAIAGVSSQLRFRLLVTAKGFAPKFVEKVEAGAELDAVSLAPRDTESIPADRSVRGRVIDPNGNAIVGAVLEVYGVAPDEQRHSFGNIHGADPMAVTDENGEFVLTSPSALFAMVIHLSARSFAKQTLQLPTGSPQVIKMTEGATLTGRLMSGGEPLANVGVGLRPFDLSAETSLGHFEIGTDEQGRFTFYNLPPCTDYRFYNLMGTMKGKGAIPIRSVHVKRDGTTTDIGDVEVKPAFHIAGRIVLDPPAEIPADSRLLVSRRNAWDASTVTVAANGEFEVDDVPAEVVTLSIRMPGYQISAKNKSNDFLNRRLIGKVDGDVRSLEILLENLDASLPIKLTPIQRPQLQPEQRPENNPLHGVEALSPQ